MNIVTCVNVKLCDVCRVVMVEREGMRRGGCGWGGGVLGRWSLRRLLLDSPLVGRRLAHSGMFLCQVSLLNNAQKNIKLNCFFSYLTFCLYSHTVS